MAKLNQVVAIEKGVKSRVYGEVTELHKAAQKPVLFNGFVKTYRRKDEDGEDYPQEQQKVQMLANDSLQRLSSLLTEMFDVTATKDFGNMSAAADIEIDGQVLVKSAPVPFLLFLEKQVNDIRTFVEKLPILDEADEWNRDDATGLYKTKAVATHRTKKVQKAIVLYDATDKHPAQTQLITEDIVAGYWDTIKHSGAIPKPRQRELLDRIEKFAKAIKTAREAANMSEAENVSVGKSIFDYLFA